MPMTVARNVILDRSADAGAGNGVVLAAVVDGRVVALGGWDRGRADRLVSPAYRGVRRGASRTGTRGPGSW